MNSWLHSDVGESNLAFINVNLMEGDALTQLPNAIPANLAAQREIASEKGHPGVLHSELRTAGRHFSSVQVAILCAVGHA